MLFIELFNHLNRLAGIMPNIEWDKLKFEYCTTKSNIRLTFKDGKWSEPRLTDDTSINLHIAASCIHYGQSCFEGLKAFVCKDGKVRLFRPGENAKRLSASSNYFLGPEISEDLFIDAVKKLVRDNIDYIPPYGTKGAMYIRPVLIGTDPRIGVTPSNSYELIILAMPVGAYYKGGLKPVNALIMDEFDRAAPNGTGHLKLAGNYAAGLKPAAVAKEKGFPINLFLDAKTKQYIEEFGTSNFIGITQDGKYVTPDSHSILPSITNNSLMILANELGFPVEKRSVKLSELKDFKEIGACGTAVIITPIHQISYGDKLFTYGKPGVCGDVLQRLYNELTAIQYGEKEDIYNWLIEV
jgi:branched-chain amino acid aminotransferase